MKKVLVLLSTYNGEKYLREQLDSVLSQEGVDVSVLIRDDGSKDGTLNILKEYSTKDNVNYYEGVNCGPSESFHDLMRHAKGYDYYAFCDQDDDWLNDKLITAVRCLERKPQELPLLYCSNLNVVDEQLNYCRLCHSEQYDLKNKFLGLVDFFAVGCTEVLNQKAIDMTIEYWSSQCLMHDSWAFMICNFLGEVYYDVTPHINYRQHGGNVVGTEKNAIGKVKASAERIGNKKIQPRWQNAKAIMDTFSESLSPIDLSKVAKMANYKNGLGKRLSLFFDFAIRANSIRKDIKYRILIIMGMI